MAIVIAGLSSLAGAQTLYTYLLEPAAGSGFFTVDDSAVPAFGTATVRAETFEGVHGGPFGYSVGNTSIVIHHVLQPNGTYTDIVESEWVPDVNASISFQDGVPSGIEYLESHSVFDTFAPQPGARFFGMSGLTWVAGEVHDLDPARGTISIFAPIPEPATNGLLIAGLAAVGVGVRRVRLSQSS
jgi:hypothetical protein